MYRNDTLSPVILYLASDLVWATRIKAAADDLGLPARPVRSLGMLDERLKDTEPTGLILDLEAPEVALIMLARLRGEAADAREKAIRIVAFAPHVKTELMQAARDAGASQVMPRGAFDHNLGDILLRLAARAG